VFVLGGHKKLADYNGAELDLFQVFDHSQGVAGLVIGVVLHFRHEIAHDEDAAAVVFHFAQTVLDVNRTVIGEIEAFENLSYRLLPPVGSLTVTRMPRRRRHAISSIR
jgi:hypothetical protein